MRKLLFIFCCAFALSLTSQTNWQWALAPDTAYATRNYVNGMSLDNNDNVFITGNYTKTLSISGATLPVPSSTDSLYGYTAKINKNGSLNWLRNTMGTFQSDVCTDNLGCSYVLGGYTASMSVSGTQLNSPNNGNAIYLLKYSAGGNLVWAKTIGTGNVTTSMIKNEGGNLYISGHILSTTVTPIYSLGTFSFNLTTVADLFYAKLDTSGTVQSAKSFAGFLPYKGFGLTVAPNGNITLLSCANVASLVVGSVTLASATSTNSNALSSILINVNQSGTVNWAKRILNGGSAINAQLCTDLNNNLYWVSSSATQSLVIDTVTLLGPSGNSLKAMLIKFDPSGNALWGKILRGTSCSSNTFNDFGYYVQVDKNGSVSVSGAVAGPSLTIGNYTASNTYYTCLANSLYVAQFTSSGAVAGVLFAGGANSNIDGYKIAVDNDYNIIVGGQYYGSPAQFGVINLYGKSDYDNPRLFVAKAGGIITGIKENNQESELNIFPIPSKSTVTFTCDKSPIKSIAIFDLTGKQIYFTNCSSTRVDVSIRDLPLGIYATRVVMEDEKIYTSKIIREE